jgi:hypothetical protein
MQACSGCTHIDRRRCIRASGRLLVSAMSIAAFTLRLPAQRSLSLQLGSVAFVSDGYRCMHGDFARHLLPYMFWPKDSQHVLAHDWRVCSSSWHGGWPPAILNGLVNYPDACSASRLHSITSLRRSTSTYLRSRGRNYEGCCWRSDVIAESEEVSQDGCEFGTDSV